MSITVFVARRIHTMNPAYPQAEAVAVQDGKVLAVGSRDEMMAWGADGGGHGEVTVDETFVDHVLLPGFVEAHSHAMVGGMWTLPYVGFFDRTGPDGRHWPGCKTIDEVIERLRAADSENPGSEPLVAWGLDPIYFEGERLIADHLDGVSEERSVFVYHVSGHLATANNALLRAEGIDRDCPTPGVSRKADGEPDGELQEPAAMSLATTAFTKLRNAFAGDEVIWNYAFEGRNAGHTFITDLGTTQLRDAEQLERWQRVVHQPGFPARVMVAAGPGFGGGGEPAELAAMTVKLRDESTDRLHFGIVKLILDGSIQGFTARVTWPGYFQPPAGGDADGHGAAEAPDLDGGHGLWLLDPNEMANIVGAYHQAGLTVHCHCNGDEAAEVFIDAVEKSLLEHPRWDHRHTVQHCQLTTPAQYRRMAAMGMCANIFSNHIFYWGDQHRDITVGPERAARMDACATAEREGVSFSFHSDTPVTPMGHLHVSWCAVNRRTATGQVLGAEEAISVDSAMRAATIGAAHQMKVDHLVGSIETGKFADFAVLTEDPYDVNPMLLKDIGVWGTVLGGEKQPAAQPVND